MTFETYFVGKERKSPYQLRCFAKECGWDGPFPTESESQNNLKAGRYLEEKGFSVRRLIKNVGDGGGGRIVDIHIDDVTQRTIPKVVIPEDKVVENNPGDVCDFTMRIYLHGKTYLLDLSFIGPECFIVQAFGMMGCIGCEDKETEKCTGKIVLATGKNSLGSDVPLAAFLKANEVREKIACSREGE